MTRKLASDEEHDAHSELRFEAQDTPTWMILAIRVRDRQQRSQFPQRWRFLRSRLCLIGRER